MSHVPQSGDVSRLKASRKSTEPSGQYASSLSTTVIRLFCKDFDILNFPY